MRLASGAAYGFSAVMAIIAVVSVVSTRYDRPTVGVLALVAAIAAAGGARLVQTMGATPAKADGTAHVEVGSRSHATPRIRQGRVSMRRWLVATATLSTVGVIAIALSGSPVVVAALAILCATTYALYEIRHARRVAAAGESTVDSSVSETRPADTKHPK